jgi:hypothetical protein
LRKIVFLITLIFILSGCSGNDLKVNSDLKSGNLTLQSFFIEKADVEIVSLNDKQSFLASVKFEFPSNYLISIRSKSGIEAARILITKDTILVNDRLNQILYMAKPDYLLKKYGVDFNLFPILFGDIVNYSSEPSEESLCEKGLRSLSTGVKGRKVDYLIDCDKKKVISAGIYRSSDMQGIVFNYKSFIRGDYCLHAGEITAVDTERAITMRIKIKRIDYQYKGKVEFIPGTGFERRDLL